MADEAIQATNDDASECKKCAVQLGYWSDSFINSFVKQFNRKAPEINRGYFARVRGIELFIEQFMKKTEKKGQIVNLGAGFDTLYWKLEESGVNLENFIEFDFPSVTAKKCYHIKRNKLLLDRLSTKDGKIEVTPTDFHAQNYHLMGADLRNTADLAKKFKDAKVDFNLPTLFLAECVLVYIDPGATSALLKYLAETFSNSLFVSYETVNMQDKFGQVMLSNLRNRGCLFAGVANCDSLNSQKERFKINGWQGCNSWTMIEVYNAIPTPDRHRIERIEMLDEQELLEQLLQHYCISIAWNGSLFENISLDKAIV